MLEASVKSIVKKLFMTKYPHLLHASNAFATITRASHFTEYNEYNLKILDKNMSSSTRYTEFLIVRSQVYVENGDTVAVALLYEAQKIFILGKVV